MSDDRELESQLGAALARHFEAEARAGCGREVELGRYAAGDLDPRERAEFEHHLERCAECHEEYRLFLLEPAPEAAAAPTPRSAWFGRLRNLRSGWGIGFASGLAAAAAALLLVVRAPSAPADDYLVAKGGQAFELAVAAVRDGRSFRVGEASILEQGDQLGFFYSAGEPGHLMVLAATPEEIARLVPASGPRSAPVAAAVESPLPDGAVFGPGAGCEWIVGLYSHQPFTEEQARAWLAKMIAGREGCRLALPADDQIEARAVTVRR